MLEGTKFGARGKVYSKIRLIRTSKYLMKYSTVGKFFNAKIDFIVKKSDLFDQYLLAISTLFHRLQ